ncbi:D-alanyl-D-alanine carboxypeptidase/D-alanyl-D-alanine endopeptidase [Streptomyces pluripotens]|uniref:D-alanyl-D-alanine carboxypeptidase/D-alanyl-D-alanine endopeptidase n=1 Tax=Streptomyces pluripotens TaxID=1355015 RepID=UPI000A6534F4|nr:D-alanyl-D-alanine carboxypeptidase/D-alanyl-D-alanine-endopeptidase [Streptomyces pluripotens]
MCLCLLALLTGSCTGSFEGSARAEDAPLDPRIQKIMDKPVYRYGQFGLLVVDPATGRTITSLNPERLFVPGSTTKLFTVSTAWDTFGSDHRTTTPVYAQGPVTDGTLDGNLVLVAQGDLTMGGRTKPDGTLDYRPVDHTYADAVPGYATLTPENPLAGLNSLAEQVRSSGITHVNGDVVIDDRLFAPDPALVTDPTPIIINDNLIDILSTPTQPGQQATFTWRPQTARNKVSYHVMTVAKGKPTAITAEVGADGVIAVTGTLAADAKPWLVTAPVTDPAAFARTAFIEALDRAGVSVAATPTGPDPAPPAKAPSGDPVARLVSAPFSQEATLILKVSHNLGADLLVCLLAVQRGSRDCEDGFASIKAFNDKVGVDPAQASQADGQGGVDGDAFTPRAFIPLLKYWTTTPEAAQFREALPILGSSGDLALVGTDSPAKGKVFAKTGTRAAGNSLTGQVLVTARAMAGYLDTGDGRYLPFVVVFNDALVDSTDGVLSIAADIAQISALLQEDNTAASASGAASASR